MKTRAPKSLTTLLLLAILIPIQAQISSDIISDEALENWLNQYTVLKRDSTQLVSPDDSLKSLVIINENIMIEEDSASVVLQDELMVRPMNAMVQLESLPLIEPNHLLSEDDLLEVHKRGILNAVYNPLFLDWVFNVNAPEGTLGMTELDSIQCELRKQARGFILSTSPELFTYHYDALPDISQIKKGKIEKLSKSDLLLEVAEGLSVPSNEKIKIEGPKPSFWTYGAQFQAQVSQAYISSNWYNGGESNLNSFFLIKGFANYNDKKRIQWENNAEWK